MYKVATATYTNNNLSLDEKFNFSEGQKLKIIIFDETNSKKDNFLDFVNRNQVSLEVDYKFNREELYDR